LNAKEGFMDMKKMQSFENNCKADINLIMVNL